MAFSREWTHPDGIDNVDSLSLEFGPFETLHKWEKMPACDEFVGARRSKHTMISFKDAVYVFGGDNGRAMLNDLLRFDVKEKSWGRAFLLPGSLPAPRYHHSAVLHHRSMFIFGGYTGDIPSNSNLTNRNDLWEYQFNTGQWTEWKNTGPRKPGARSAHGAAVHDGSLFIFAGYDGNCRLNDMWSICLGCVPSSPVAGLGDQGQRVWEQVHFFGESPPTCCNFPVAVARDCMFVFSGQSGAKITNSLFQFHFPSKTWSQIGTEHILRDVPAAPTRRYGHSMVAFDQHLYVFGGAADNILPNSLHAFDLDSHTWSVIDVSADSQTPSGRLFHAAALVGDQMFVFGGTSDNNTRSGEMFRFQLGAFPKCTLLDDFGQLLRCGQFCDVHFIVGSGLTIPAHTPIVVARSECLRQRIQDAKRRVPENGDAGTQVLEVSLPEVEDACAFRLFLDFVYTDCIDPTEKGAKESGSDAVVLLMMHVYMLSSTFKMHRLENLCARYIESCISLNNVLKALKNASLLGLSKIKEFCMKFIIREPNYSQIIMSTEFETLDQALMVDIIRRRQAPHSAAHGPESQPSAGTLALPGTTLQEDMKRFLMNSDFADVLLVLADEEFPAHKAVLAARSAYFEGMFRSFNPANRRVPVAIGNMVPSTKSFHSLLRYIYYGEVVMPPEDSLYLFSAPHFYIFSNNRLQVFCKHNLERNVRVDNVLQILEASDSSHTLDMKRYALSLIVQHFAKIAPLPKLQTLSRELLLDILQALAEARVDSAQV